MPEPRHTVLDIVDRLDRAAEPDRVTVAHVLRAFGASAFLPVMMLPALLVVSPLSGIPFFSSLCGLTIALVAAQMLLGRRRLWVPEMIRRREIAGARLRDGAGRLRGLADWMDRHTHGRLAGLAGRGFHGVVLAACLVAGLSMPFLEIVPFSSSVLGLAVLLFCTGLLSGDGLFVLAGFAVLGVAAMIPAALVTGLASL